MKNQGGNNEGQGSSSVVVDSGLDEVIGRLIRGARHEQGMLNKMTKISVTKVIWSQLNTVKNNQYLR